MTLPLVESILSSYTRNMKVSIICHPNSKRPRIEIDLLGTLHVHVNQPPLEGKANLAVIEALAKHYNVRKADVQLIAGHKSKIKLLEISKE